jgi:hypothetical protein
MNISNIAPLKKAASLQGNHDLSLLADKVVKVKDL